ncbi:hypothetical protein CTI12_AA575090 [Artemisia annua]|uniref:FH2 domain-containing protein n=1 Tax=Artemisia annua TaxID=35608 RepID=A0A2U1KQT9_ARTAN|nr:hypothetical protein CTI12_AA575090 [Artemisia annua]
MIVEGTKDVRSSFKFRRIMQTILSLGNDLNQGTARGAAVSFKLDSLLKLNETRARSNKYQSQITQSQHINESFYKLNTNKQPTVDDKIKWRNLVNAEASRRSTSSIQENFVEVEKLTPRRSHGDCLLSYKSVKGLRDRIMSNLKPQMSRTLTV